MPGRALALIGSDDDFIGAAGTVETVRDVSGELLALLDRCGAAALVVRPDRYLHRAIGARELCEPAGGAEAPQDPRPAPWPTSALPGAQQP
jgi:hypothetical protein